MFKQLALSLCAGLLLSLPACGCKDECSKKTAETTTSVDAQTTNCSDETCKSCETPAETVVTEEAAPAKF
jgi:hypothetical protein